jgi:hypothetical protein
MGMTRDFLREAETEPFSLMDGEKFAGTFKEAQHQPERPAPRIFRDA